MAKTPNADTPSDETPNNGEIQPTEQIPSNPKPVSARAAASGGASGLGKTENGADSSTDSSTKDAPVANQNIFRRHPLGAGITVGVIAVILVSGLTAWGVGSAVTASLTSSNGSAQLAPAPSATPAPASGAGGKLAGGHRAFRATIQSISDSSWTILTKKGKTVTVAVDGSTQFGTKRMSQTASNFAVGDNVIIVATMTGDTTTATRVVNASDVGKGAGAGGGTGAGAGTMAPMPTPAPSAST